MFTMCHGLSSAVLSLLGTRDQFYGRQFFPGLGEGGMGFGGDSNALHLLCTLFLFCGNFRISGLDFRLRIHAYENPMLLI